LLGFPTTLGQGLKSLPDKRGAELVTLSLSPTFTCRELAEEDVSESVEEARDPIRVVDANADASFRIL
jgi:hypothetical protein